MNTYKVSTTLEGREITGQDSCILEMPPELYISVGDGPPALDVRRLGLALRSISMLGASNIGERLHHAEWVITSDPAVVEERGMHDPGCATCRSSVDDALGLLARTEGKAELLVGTLYWSA